MLWYIFLIVVLFDVTEHVHLQRRFINLIAMKLQICLGYSQILSIIYLRLK